MEPPLYLQKTIAHLSRNFVQTQIDWTGRTDNFSQKQSKWAWFYLKVGVASKISHYWNPPSTNPGSTTVNCASNTIP